MTPSNIAAWLPATGAALEVKDSEYPIPGEGEIVIENHAIPLQPADWKLQKGVLPIPLKFPSILGMSLAGTVHAVGPGVTRFVPGDRVISCTAMILRGGDTRFGGYQKYVLSTAAMTAPIGATLPFAEASTAASTAGNAMSALHLHLDLNRPTPSPTPKTQTLLVWGGASSMGQFAIQMAALAGYTVVTVASPRHAEFLLSLGAAEVHDYALAHNALLAALQTSPHAPYYRVFSAADTAASQDVMGALLAAQGGGSFLATMGLRKGVTLPDGVQGRFVQYLDDYLMEEHGEFRDWFYEEWLGDALQSGTLKTGRVEVIEGGLSAMEGALRKLEAGVSGVKLVVKPVEGA